MDKIEKINELMKLFGGWEVFDQKISSLFQELKEISLDAPTLFTEEVEGLKSRIINIWASYIEEDFIDTLIIFYSSDFGQKILSLNRIILNDVNTEITNWYSKLISKIGESIIESDE